MRLFRTSSLPLLVGLSSVVLFGAGCNPAQTIGQKVAEKVVENSIKTQTGGNVDVNVNDNTVKITGENGATYAAGDNVSIPSDFPKSIPIYPGTKVKSAITVPGEDGASVVLETGDKGDVVRDWYKKQAVDGGWKQSASLDLDGGNYMIAFTRTEGSESYSMTVSISPDESTGKTGIVLGYGKK